MAFVGMPATLKLNEFASHVLGFFGGKVVHVGSSVKSKEWRDVDVRVLLSNEAYVKLFDLDTEHYDESKYVEGTDFVYRAAKDHWNRDVHKCEKWVALVLAFSALGKEMTGLPIDFQIMPESVADHIYPVESDDSRGCNPRHYIGFVPLRCALDNQEKAATGATAGVGGGEG